MMRHMEGLEEQYNTILLKSHNLCVICAPAYRHTVPAFLPRARFTFEYNRSRAVLRASGKPRLITFIFKFLPEGFWFHFDKGGGAV